MCWGWGEEDLGTKLSFLPTNRSGSGEVSSAGTFQDFPVLYFWHC